MPGGGIRGAARGLGPAIGLAVAFMVASTVGTATAVVLAGSVVDRIAAGQDATGTAAWALVAGLVGVLSWSASDVVVARVATRMALRLRGTMVRHTLALPTGFFTERSVGEVTDRISTDVDTVSQGIVNQVKPIAMGLLGAVVAVVTTTTVDVRLAALFVPFAALLGWSGLRSGRVVAERSRQLQAEWAEAAGTAEEAFGARDDLRQALGRGLVMRRWSEHLARLYVHVQRLARAKVRLSISTVGLLRGFQIVVVAAGAALVAAGQLGAGDVWAAFGLVTVFSRRAEEVLNNLPKLSDLVAASQRIEELLDEPAEPPTTTSGVGAAAVRWDDGVALEVRRASFAYGAGPEVLHDVSFALPPGRSLALVGRTGSGKTTLARLVNRMVESPVGTTFLDGVDVCAIPVDELRAHVGVVSQRVELLRTSLRDNIALFDPAIDDDRITSALDHLGLGTWLSQLPAGLDTEVGERGLWLSAGEEQLVAFARLLVRDPAVVILDEATARLDPGTERLLQTATERLLAGRTSIIIAHRLSTVSAVDDVCVLEGGRVVEHGRRVDLLATPGSAFAALVQSAGGIEVSEVVEPHRRRVRPVAEEDAELAVLEDAATRADAIDGPGPRLRPLRTALRLLGRHRDKVVPGLIGWGVFFVAPAVTAWVWIELLPALESGASTTWLVAVLAAAAVVGLAGRALGETYFSRWWNLSNATMRSNLLAAQLHPVDRHAGSIPASPGEAVSRMWDTNDAVAYADHVVDLCLGALFILAVTVLTGTASTLGWLLLPIVVPALVCVALRRRIERVAVEHARLRGIWTGRVAEVCAAATTIKGFGGEEHVVAHVDVLTRQRQRWALAQRDLELTVFGSVFFTSEVAQRLLLLGVAGLAAAGSAGVAEVGEAVAVAEAIAMMPIAGIVTCMLILEAPMVRAKLRRISRLLPAQPGFDLTTPPADLLLPPVPVVPTPTGRPGLAPLRHIDLDDLSVVFDDGTVALDDVTLHLERGELVIVTGPIAAGKSTLLRVLAGLCRPSEGTLRWNGATLDDPSAFLRPPNCAYVAQAPRLLSGTVEENVSLDHGLDVPNALGLAEMDHDLEAVGGPAARVGHRGLRLSGGQTQRLATARALAATDELLVLDDLSSALDVVTERQLWANVRGTGRTVVATSYKRSALELADRIVVLRHGQVASVGRLDDLEAGYGHLFA